MKEILSIVSGMLLVFGYVPYFRAILRKTMQPTKSTWIIWTMLDSIAFAGMYSKHILNWQITCSVVCTLATMLLAFKYGLPGWDWAEKTCIVIAASSIALWLIFDNPVLGITMSMTGLAAGAIPTFLHSWVNPARENRTSWTIGWFGCAVAIFAIPQWTLAHAVQPIAFITIQTIAMYILYFSPRALEVDLRKIGRFPKACWRHLIEHWREMKMEKTESERVWPCVLLVIVAIVMYIVLAVIFCDIGAEWQKELDHKYGFAAISH